MERIGFMASEEKSFENVYGRTTDACLYYKLTYELSAQVSLNSVICKQNMTLSHIDTVMRNEPRHDKTHKMIGVPREDSDQPWHPPSLIRVFAVHMKKYWALSYPLSAQRKL